jgi:hypothetical protein
MYLYLNIVKSGEKSKKGNSLRELHGVSRRGLVLVTLRLL